MRFWCACFRSQPQWSIVIGSAAAWKLSGAAEGENGGCSRGAERDRVPLQTSPCLFSILEILPFFLSLPPFFFIKPFPSLSLLVPRELDCCLKKTFHSWTAEVFFATFDYYYFCVCVCSYKSLKWKNKTSEERKEIRVIVMLLDGALRWSKRAWGASRRPSI